MVKPGDKICVDRNSLNDFGTLGGVLRVNSAGDPRLFAMTCAHVFAAEGAPRRGSAVFDGQGNQIGTCVGGTDRWQDGLDMALVELTAPVTAASSGRGVPAGRVIPAGLLQGEHVIGVGAGSGVAVKSTVANISEDIDVPAPRPYHLPAQVLLNHAFMDGDSGAWVLDDDDMVIGMQVGWTGEPRNLDIVTPIRPLIAKASELAQVPLTLVTDPAQFAPSDRAPPVTPTVPQAGLAAGLGTDVLHTFACTIWGEARGEGQRGMEAVACIIRNRVQNPRWWGKDYSSVCLAHAQFSCWNPSDPNFPKLRTVTEADPQFKMALDVAHRASDGSLKDPTSNADSYYADSIPAPSWTAHATFTIQIGNHRFYRVELPPFHDAPAVA